MENKEQIIDNEMINNWFNKMLDSEIKEAQGTIRNEHLWELGYDGEEPNPHTLNIENLKEYIKLLESSKK